MARSDSFLRRASSDLRRGGRFVSQLCPLARLTFPRRSWNTLCPKGRPTAGKTTGIANTNSLHYTLCQVNLIISEVLQNFFLSDVPPRQG